jgi:hypothetical protein
MVTEKSTALYEQMRITTISSQEAITQVNTLLTSAAQICSGIKATYQAKPKLNYENVLGILVLPHRILNMFCHSHLCPEYVQGLFYDFSESTCEIVP